MRPCSCKGASHGPDCALLADEVLEREEPRKPLRAPAWPRCVRCSKPCKPSEMERDELGRPYCSGGRCGTAAVEEVSQGKLRREVFLRDGGICSACGLDAEKLRAEIDGLLLDARAHAPTYWKSTQVLEARVHQLVRLGFDKHAVESGDSLWEAHHVSARVSGGPSVLSNMETVCGACHSGLTRALAKKRAASRRPGGGR